MDKPQQLNLENVTPEQAEDIARHQRRMREAKTAPCPDCGEEVVQVQDATVGYVVQADPRQRVLLVIGRTTNGTPIAARPSNGLVLHVCRPKEGRDGIDAA